MIIDWIEFSTLSTILLEWPLSGYEIYRTVRTQKKVICFHDLPTWQFEYLSSSDFSVRIHQH